MEETEWDMAVTPERIGRTVSEVTALQLVGKILDIKS
jgi:hypothetical protein